VRLLGESHIHHTASAGAVGQFGWSSQYPWRRRSHFPICSPPGRRCVRLERGGLLPLRLNGLSGELRAIASAAATRPHREHFDDSAIDILLHTTAALPPLFASPPLHGAVSPSHDCGLPTAPGGARFGTDHHEWLRVCGNLICRSFQQDQLLRCSFGGGAAARGAAGTAPLQEPQRPSRSSI